MKYFTLDWWEDSLEINDRDVSREYQDYYYSIKDELPNDIRKFCEEVNLHDGKLLKLSSDFHEGTVEIEFIGYNYDENYSSVGLRKFYLKYFNVINFSSISDPQRGLSGPHGYGDFGYDEIEMISSEHFEHRILFSSGIEIRINYKSFKLEYSDIEN